LCGQWRVAARRDRNRCCEEMREIEMPIVFIGVGRSGTTVVYDTFAARSDLAWFSQYLNRRPQLPSVTLLSRLADLSPVFRRAPLRSDQRGAWLERLRVGPSEANLAWQHLLGERFGADFLLGLEATDEERRRTREAVAKVLRYQGKARFAMKITGPARIGYLTSVFEDALFVHVVRDGQAVVNSLLKVDFWRNTSRLWDPAWANGLSDAELSRWEQLGRSSLALAAIEWCAVLARAREEAERLAPERYAEVRYEDFVGDPHRVLDELADFCCLPRSRDAHDFLDARVELEDMNFRWRDAFSPAELELLNEAMDETLAEFGYDLDSGPIPRGGACVRRPFGALSHAH
jgi:omega-hydroxy-beta-dihydromenaquinone-9 sulfotransferase